MELRLWLLSLQQPTFLPEKGATGFSDSPTCSYSQAKEKEAIVYLGSSSWHAQRQQNPPPEHGRGEQGLTVFHYSIIRGQIRRVGQGTALALGRFSSSGKAYPGSASLTAVFCAEGFE